MVLTQKIKAGLGGGNQFRVYNVTALGAGANNISAPLLDLNRVTMATFVPHTVTTSAGATSLSGNMTTNSGDTVVITCLTASEAGTIKAWGY